MFWIFLDSVHSIPSYFLNISGFCPQYTILCSEYFWILPTVYHPMFWIFLDSAHSIPSYVLNISGFCRKGNSSRPHTHWKVFSSGTEKFLSSIRSKVQLWSFRVSLCYRGPWMAALYWSSRTFTPFLYCSFLQGWLNLCTICKRNTTENGNEHFGICKWSPSL